MNSNYWGILCIPIGLVLCFGPALLATVLGVKDDPNIADRGKPRDP
jgi:hypothetical protein